MTKQQQSERDEAIARLRETLKPGDTVYTQVKHVSRSGMLRVIQCVVIEDNQPRWIGWNVARAIRARYDDKREGVVMGGCGMDMGFETVYHLSYALFPDGFECIGNACPSSDHVNGDRDYTPHRHGSGAYALNHRWL